MKDFNRKCASIVMDAHSHVRMKVFVSIQLDVCYYVIGSFPRTTGPDTAYSRQVAIVHAPFGICFPSNPSTWPRREASQMGEPGFRQVCRECAGCAMPCKQLEPVEVAFCRLRRDAGDGGPPGKDVAHQDGRPSGALPNGDRTDLGTRQLELT